MRSLSGSSRRFRVIFFAFCIPGACLWGAAAANVVWPQMMGGPADRLTTGGAQVCTVVSILLLALRQKRDAEKALLLRTIARISRPRAEAQTRPLRRIP